MKQDHDISAEPQGNLAYDRVIEEIETGRLSPGDRLRETELAERLGVSRTPVREAIRQLEADGIVAHVPRSGATVRKLDYAEVTELYEMRAVLEGTAARLAARMASEVEIAELTALNEELGMASDAQAAKTLNRVFHGTLVNAARNRFLSQSMASLHKALLVLGPTTLQDDRRAGATAEHTAVLNAMADRDGVLAEALMRQHIEASQAVRLKTLRDL